MIRVAAWIAIGAAACGDGAIRPDAAIDVGGGHPDAAVPAVGEADECAGAPLIPRQGTPSIASSYEILGPFDGVDLDGDSFPDNYLSQLRSFVGNLMTSELAGGGLAIPIEVFDHGPDPDPCVKLALYRGRCASPPCDFTDGVPDTVALEPSSIAGGVPVSRLRAMQSASNGEVTAAGPGYVELPIPFLDQDGIVRTFALPLTVQYAAGQLGPAGLETLHVAGIVQAFRLGQIPAPVIGTLGIELGDTELDAVFANLLGHVYLNLPRRSAGCLGTDMDPDGDGFEVFCDTDPGDGELRVDTCIDGSGIVLHDGDNGVADCSQAMKHGRPRFVDGISGQVLLSAQPGTFTP